MNPSREMSRIPLAPPRPCPDIAVETWDPSLDPCAISREATAPSPWSAVPLAALLALALGTTAVLVPWYQPRKERSTFSPGSRCTIAFALREVLPAPSRDDGPLHAPGGGAGRPQWAPIATPGMGGMGDLQAIPAVKAFAPQGALSSPAMGLAPATALGGGLTARTGVGGGSPNGTAGGIGGGARGGTRGAEKPLSDVSVPMLVPTYRKDISYTLPAGTSPVRTVVIVRALVLMDGTVQSVTFQEGPVALKERALAAALLWRFRPLAVSGFQEPAFVDIIFDSAYKPQ